MNNILLIFASMSGNTEAVADEIVNGIKRAGGSVNVLDLIEVESASILLEYDAFLLGAYTWGDGELPDEFLDFYNEMNDLDLNGKMAAAFGSGDTSYPQFCKAVDLIEERLRERGAKVVQEGLKIELAPTDEEIEKCQKFGEQFVQMVYPATL